MPARIFPVFRDREELPTAVDLGEIINGSLAQSRYLIVICSPASARSQWVNQEIIQFKRLGGENRVLTIIVEAEPNASSGKPGFTVSVLNLSPHWRSPWAVKARPVRRLLRLLPWSGARRRCGRGSARRLVPGWRRGYEPGTSAALTARRTTTQSDFPQLTLLSLRHHSQKPSWLRVCARHRDGSKHIHELRPVAHVLRRADELLRKIQIVPDSQIGRLLHAD